MDLRKTTLTEGCLKASLDLIIFTMLQWLFVGMSFECEILLTLLTAIDQTMGQQGDQREIQQTGTSRGSRERDNKGHWRAACVSAQSSILIQLKNCFCGQDVTVGQLSGSGFGYPPPAPEK